MKQNKLLCSVAIILIISITAGSVFIYAENTENINNKNTSTNNTTSDLFENRYTTISSNYTAATYTKDVLEYTVDTVYESGTAKLTKENYEYKNDVLKMQMEDNAVFTIDVPKTAVYYLSFDYLSYDESILPVEMSMKVNGEYPFYETRRLIYESKWEDPEEKSYDRYGNQVVAVPNKIYKWNQKYLMDASYRHSMPLGLELSKGKNELSFTITEGNVLFGNLYLNPEPTIEDYTGSQKAEGNSIYTIEAEEPTTRNDSSIRSLCEYDTDLTPYDIESRSLNTLDGDSFKDAGQTISYEQTIEQSGYYYIALNYKQSEKANFPVFLDIRVDGEIPNTQFQAYPLHYYKKYKTITLQDEEEQNLSIYLEEGTHTISFTISIDPIKHILEKVDEIASDINNLSLEITKVAGTNKDKYRDLKMESYIPNVGEQLYGYADELELLVDSVRQYANKVKDIGTFSPIYVASNQLRSLAKDPNELPYRVSELSQSVNSVTKFLADVGDNLNKNKLSLDRIYLYQENASLPKKTGVFQSLGMSIKRFASSFMEQAYSTKSGKKDHLQVWVNRSRQHLEIMQKMIDEEFTSQTGISVDVSLMPDQNKLILANASGDAPDIATGINYAIPFDLGIRGAIKDLTEFEDFTEIAERYPTGLLVPATIEDGIYALPETRNFWVLFYRSDILEKLGLEVPDTIEDVKNMLPELQMRGLNFYYPTAGMLAMRTFHGTTPLLFQYGATLYGEFAGDTAINSEQAVAGFKELTELFTIYNLPKDIPSFYQHFRNGDLPIGIADYSVYNLLTNAAPEIASSWDIAVVPGVENEEGEVLRYTSGGMESTVMFHSNEEREEQAWEFMKWWSSAEVQAEFGQTLQITYGDEYIWSTANSEAFTELPIKAEDKKIIAKQDEWILESPRILGTYMLEREMSNAYNSIVVNGKNLRITLDNTVKRIDRETERKLEEFGYMENGEVIKQYTVPTNETVERILEEHRKE